MRCTKELLGARIREIRKGMRLSQEQLAEKVDVDPRYISRIELGKCFPSLGTLDKIAHAFDVELRDLFEFRHLTLDSAAPQDIGSLFDGVDSDTRQLIFRITKAVTRAVTSNL